jgi:hypothetical protein
MKHWLPFATVCFALALTACQPMAPAVVEQNTTTPEVFIPLDKAIPDYGLTLEGVHL